MKNDLSVKEVGFQSDYIMAAQDNESGKIYVGVRWICNGIGLSRGQINNENNRIQKDHVLKLGCTKFGAGVFDENNDTIAIELDFLPLWLAKISITPKMIQENNKVAEKLISYQLKAKDILAKAFIKKEDADIDNFHIPTTLSEALQLSANLAKENEEMKPKAEQFDMYISTTGTLSMNKTAKALKTKRNKLMAFLRFKKVLNEDNSPSSYYCNKDYFEVKNYTIKTKSEKKYQISVTRTTSKGQDFLYRYLKNHINEYLAFDTDYAKKIQEVSINV